MRFLKRLSALLLAMLSLCSLSLTACTKDLVKDSTPTRPSVESELPESVTSEESATSDEDGKTSEHFPDSEELIPPVIEDSTTSEETVESSSPENTKTEKNFFPANYYDVTFNTVLATDKKSILVEVTPKYHIYNLQIEIKFLFISMNCYSYADMESEVHLNTFEKASANKTISFRVYLSDERIKENFEIGIYEYDVIGGEYYTTTDYLSRSIDTVYANDSNLTKADSDLKIDFSFSIDKTYLIINLYAEKNLYNVQLDTYFGLASYKDLLVYSEPQLVTIDFLPQGQHRSYCLAIPDYFVQQNLSIYLVRFTRYMEYRISPSGNLTATDEYWAQFE